MDEIKIRFKLERCCIISSFPQILFFFYVCSKTAQKTDVQEKKKEGLWSKVKREYFPLRNCGRVLKLTSKQHFSEIHTQICYADLSLVVMHCFSFSVVAGVKIGGFRRIEQDWS